MLTLRPAFGETDHARLISQIASTEPTRPSRRYPGLSRDLETVVLKAMAKEPAHRYQTASDLASDLRRVLADQPVAARRPAMLERSVRWARRNPTVAGLATALLVLSATCFSIVFWKWREPSPWAEGASRPGGFGTLRPGHRRRLRAAAAGQRAERRSALQGRDALLGRRL